VLGVPKDIEWFVKKIRPLLDLGKKYDELFPGEYYKPREWALVKLIILNYYIPIYTTLIRKNFSGKMRYIDLLCGSGLCQIASTKDVVAGSALIAAHSKIPFDEYIFIDTNKKFCDDLERRMSYTKRTYKIYNRDCNKCIPSILNTFKEDDHFLAFVDNEGLDVSWNTIEALLLKKGDLIINFQTNGVNRMRAAAQIVPGDEVNLNRLYGDERWKKCSSEKEVLDLYIKKIKENSDREQIVILPVKGQGGYKYDLILATRKTLAENPWLEPMRTIGELFKKYGSNYVKMALELATERQANLKEFF